MAAAAHTMVLGARAQEQAQCRAPASERAVPLPALTGLRFVAALWVLVLHRAMPVLGLLPPVPVLRASILGAASLGYVGVNVFFVLSGFILAHSYLGASGDLRTSARGFWTARVARIAPVYLLAFALAVGPALWTPAAPAVRALSALATLLAVQAWLPSSLDMWNIPSWTISTEAFFYLLFPLLAPALARLAARQLVLVAACAWLLPLAMAVVAPGSVAGVLGLPLLRLPEFVLGIAAARLLARYRSWMGWRFWPLAALALVVASAHGRQWPALLPPLGLFDPLIAAVLCGLATQRGAAVRLLRLRCVVLLGEASYALYILQWPVWDWMVRLLGPAASAHTVPFVLLYAGVLLGIALAAYRLVEQPARRGLRRALG